MKGWVNQVLDFYLLYSGYNAITLFLNIQQVFKVKDVASAGFTYRLDRLKPRASKFRGPPAKVYNVLILLLDFHTYAVMTYCTF